MNLNWLASASASAFHAAAAIAQGRTLIESPLAEALASPTASLIAELTAAGIGVEAFFGHAVADTTRGLEALIGAASGFPAGGFLVPTRNSELFRWCLGNRLRLVHQMTLMTMGVYNEPVGAYLPSVLF